MTAASAAIQEINIAHSPDSDDAFMFYGLATNKVRVPGFKFNHTLTDIETLNQRAIHDPFYDVTAISFHAYPYMQEQLHPDGLRRLGGRGLWPHGGRAAQALAGDIKKTRIAVPGDSDHRLPHAQALRPRVETVTVPFDKIIPAVVAGEFDAGLIIHEGQLTYGNNGLTKALDLGQWWREQTGLPLPLGGNAIRRSLGDDVRCGSRPRRCATASSTRSITARKRSSTPCSSPATSTRHSPTSSSACTSTSAR
jgi:1,4-dihydroxy-6-naphthoate synthase